MLVPEFIEFKCPVILNYQTIRSDVPQGEDELTQFLSGLAWTHPELFYWDKILHPNKELTPRCMICGSKDHEAIKGIKQIVVTNINKSLS